MLSALIVDDEPLANERLRSLLEGHAGIKVAAVAESLREARKRLAEAVPDVVFLDVRMPGGSGLDLLSDVPDGSLVVFVTAHETYAVDAFAVSALDYLVKPVDPERLAETVRRLEEMALLRKLKAAAAGGDASRADREDAEDSRGHEATTGRTTDRGKAGEPLGLGDTIHVPLEAKGRSAMVTIGDICWIESFRNYTRVGLQRPGRVMIFRRRLGQWEADLPAGLFERLGKSLVVQVGLIQETEWKSRDETVVMFGADAPPLTIGRQASLLLQDVLSGDLPGRKSRNQD